MHRPQSEVATAGALLSAINRKDLAIVALLVVLPIVWFNQVLWPSFSGKTMLPYDNLYAFEPWHSLRPDVVPYNPLISDLVLETAVWELHARRSFMSGQLPLWNPQILAGAPFLADAQGSVLYPLDLVLYWLPLADAFAWYTALHVTLAGLGSYALGRLIGMRRAAALFTALAFMFSGAFITNATFPQIIGVAAWIPVLLAIAELVVQRGRASLWLWIGGTLAVATQFLAGQPEISIYALLMMAAYVAPRLVMSGKMATWAAVHITSLVAVGAALAAVQLLPTLEAVNNNMRTGVRSATDLATFAWPLPQLWTFLLPDLFGNPTHRQWLDIWSGTWRDNGQPIFWGAKNYVEAGQYLGVLTWLLAIVGVMRGRRAFAVIFGALGLVSLLFVLGSPLYMVLQAVPGFPQLRSPFRWVLPFSVTISLLAGLGLDALLARPRLARAPAILGMMVGTLALGCVAASVVWSEPFLKLAQRFVTDPAWAERAFGGAYRDLPRALSTPQMFWGYESQGLLRLGVCALLGAAALLMLRHRQSLAAAAVCCLVVLDVYSVHGRFLPASDIALAPQNNKPPVVQAIEQREQHGEPWRFTTYEHDDEKTFQANAGMYYGWQDARGYDSIVPRWYAEFTRRLGLPIASLTFNRIAPVYDAKVLDNNMLDLLNVKYVLTEQRIDDPNFVEVYRDGHIAAYQKTNVLPRSWVARVARVLPPNEQPLERTDLRDVVYLENDPGREALAGGGRGTSRVEHYGYNNITLTVDVDGPAWLVLADSWGPGWHARATRGSGTALDLSVYRADSAVRAMRIPGAGSWRVELSYWPDSVQMGLAVSGAAALVVLAVLVTNTGWVLAVGRSVPSRPLRVPYSPAGREA
jgi:hypothetical protein